MALDGGLRQGPESRGGIAADGAVGAGALDDFVNKVEKPR